MLGFSLIVHCKTLKELNALQSSSLTGFYVFNRTLYFQAYGLHDNKMAARANCHVCLKITFLTKY